MHAPAAVALGKGSLEGLKAKLTLGEAHLSAYQRSYHGVQESVGLHLKVPKHRLELVPLGPIDGAGSIGVSLGFFCKGLKVVRPHEVLYGLL